MGHIIAAPWRPGGEWYRDLEASEHPFAVVLERPGYGGLGEDHTGCLLMSLLGSVRGRGVRGHAYKVLCIRWSPVFTIPLDAKNRMEEQADKFYRNHETAGTTPTFWLYYLSRDEVHDFNHLFRATLLGEARPEYNNCLAPYMRNKIGVDEFDKLNPETPYALLYSDFFGLPHDDSVRKALRHVMFPFRNTANAVVPRVIGRARTPGGTWGFSLAPQHCACTEINRCVCPLPPTPPVVENEEVGGEEHLLPHDGEVADDNYDLGPSLPAPSLLKSSTWENWM